MYGVRSSSGRVAMTKGVVSQQRWLHCCRKPGREAGEGGSGAGPVRCLLKGSGSDRSGLAISGGSSCPSARSPWDLGLFRVTHAGVECRVV